MHAIELFGSVFRWLVGLAYFAVCTALWRFSPLARQPKPAEPLAKGR